MSITNFEFKARCLDISLAESKIQSLNPVFVGLDNQTDTYFNVDTGRLKLREGNIENALIYYLRPNCPAFKQSDVLIYSNKPDPALKSILASALGIRVIVSKSRKIYLVENVKIHFDLAKDLGTFIEVEAIDRTGEIGIARLEEQCSRFAKLIGIDQADYIAESYGDMINM